MKLYKNQVIQKDKKSKMIFPKEIIENTVEVHRFKNKTKSKIIYGILLFSLLCIIASLPFISLDIYSSSQGILKSEKERNQVYSLYSGRIKSIHIEENMYVEKGDTILIVDNAIGDKKKELLTYQIKESKLFVHDLLHLINVTRIKQDSLLSYLYQKEYLQYSQKLQDLNTHYKKNNDTYLRQKKLLSKGVISRVDFENSFYDLELSRNAINNYKKQMQNQWQTALVKEKNKEKELETSHTQIKEEQENYIVKAIINGTLQNVKGLEVGNFITTGTSIAEISPDTDLIVECYISPSDIGLLKEGSEVKFQINAFNYNQWGMATGKIKAINNDISIINSVPMFRVICVLDQKKLQLKNGFEGKLRKGMTLNARFFITTRSVFNLLYDKAEDWFNPGNKNED